MRLRSITYCLLLLLFSACEEKVNLPLDSQQTNYIVVSGIVTNENVSHVIKLTRPHQTQNGTPQPVSGAIITITEDYTTVYDLTETPAGSGEYYTPQMRAVVGKNYQLIIHYNGAEFTAEDSPTPVEPLSPISYFSKDGSYELSFSASGQDPNFIQYDISWENTTACTGGASCKGELFYYDLKNVDINEIYRPTKTDFLFPLNTTIVRRKYSTSDAYKNFLRSMLSETEWRGGVFDVQRADVPTNLSEGAIGFFAVSTVVADTVIVQ